MIVAVGWGWSFIHLRHDQKYILAGAVAALINTAAIIVSAYAEEVEDNHHLYDSMAGILLLAMRISVLVIFLVGIMQIRAESAGRILLFIRKVALIGSLYLSSWAVIVIIV